MEETLLHRLLGLLLVSVPSWALEPLKHSTVMDSEGSFVFSWTPHQDHLVIELQVRHFRHLTPPNPNVLLWIICELSPCNPWWQLIQFSFQARTRGYLGIGFSPNGGMVGADIYIGGIDPLGKPYLIVSFCSFLVRWKTMYRLRNIFYLH